MGGDGGGGDGGTHHSHDTAHAGPHTTHDRYDTAHVAPRGPQLGEAQPRLPRGQHCDRARGVWVGTGEEYFKAETCHWTRNARYTK